MKPPETPGRTTDLPLLLFLLLPFVTAFLLWDEIPDPFPLRWNAAGELIDLGDKMTGLLFFPVLNIGFAVYVTVVPWLLGKIAKKFADVRNHLVVCMRSIRMGVAVIFTVVSLDLLGAASGRLSHRLMTDLPGVLAILGFWFAWMFVTLRPLLLRRRTA